MIIPVVSFHHFTQIQWIQLSGTFLFPGPLTFPPVLCNISKENYTTRSSLVLLVTNFSVEVVIEESLLSCHNQNSSPHLFFSHYHPLCWFILYISSKDLFNCCWGKKSAHEWKILLSALSSRPQQIIFFSGDFFLFIDRRYPSQFTISMPVPSLVFFILSTSYTCC